MAYHTLTPAYGKVYTTKREVVDAWVGNTDFRLATTGQYLTRSEAKKYLPGDSFEIRYGKNLEKVVATPVVRIADRLFNSKPATERKPMEAIQIYRDTFQTGKFSIECLGCMEVMGTGRTLIAATNSAMAHNFNKHYNTLPITICKCDECALAIYQLYHAELENTE